MTTMASNASLLQQQQQQQQQQASIMFMRHNNNNNNNNNNNHHAVIQDLLAALEDDDLTDLTLVGHDGVPVRACRFILAARSKVLKRMLYGNFREAHATEIPLDFPGPVLRGIVEYCTKNSLPNTCTRNCNDNSSEHAHEASIRLLVNLAQAADYFELSGLAQMTERLVRQRMAKSPLLACPVFDEATEGSTLYTCACRMIRTRPYVALLPCTKYNNHTDGGGVESLQADRMVTLLKDTEIEAGELFLFDMLQRWVDHVPASHRRQALQVARDCGTLFRLHYIEPDQLLSRVQQSGLFPPNLIVEAIMRQALKASQNRVWTINCRGKDANVDRVLVEASGNPHVNGVYYRIRGLNKGDVYSKREVSCGQLYVYTLSCTQKDDTIESRIFCSKVLSHRAISNIVAAEQSLQQAQAQPPRVALPVFQPLLQIIQLEPPLTHGTESSPLAKLCKIQLSDGDHYISGTLAGALTPLVEQGQVTEYSLVKLLAYDQYSFDGKQSLHILDMSVVSAHPGHQLGKPVELVTHNSSRTDDNNNNNNNNPDEPADDGLQKLYSCYYPMDQQAKDSKIPRSGWKIEDRGVAPAPRCTWIPATSRKFGDISRCQSEESDQ